MIIFFGILTLFHFILLVLNVFKYNEARPAIYNGFMMVMAFIAMSYYRLEALIGG